MRALTEDEKLAGTYFRYRARAALGCLACVPAA